MHTRSLDLRLLQTFRAVAETGSVTAAAAVCLVSQPALSRQVQQLERALGFPLFDRGKGRMRLTAGGRTFLQATVEILGAADAAQALADSIAAGRLARVRMAAPTTTLSDVLTPFLSRLGPDDPLITVEEAHHDAAIAGLHSGIDLAVVTSPPPRELGRTDVAVLPVWAYVAAEHPLSGAEALGLEEIAEHRLILLDPSFRARQLVDEALIEIGASPPEVLECSHPQVAQALAAAGRGVAVVSDDPRFGMTPAYIEAAHGRLSLTLHAAWNPQHHAATELGRLAGRLRAFCREQYAQVAL